MSHSLYRAMCTGLLLVLKDWFSCTKVVTAVTMRSWWVFLRCTVGSELRLHGLLLSYICGRCVYECLWVREREWAEAGESLRFRSTLQRRAVHAVHNSYISHTQTCCPVFILYKNRPALMLTAWLGSLCVSLGGWPLKRMKESKTNPFSKKYC